MKTEDIRTLLAEKFSREKKRLKTFGTKVDSFQLANVVYRYIESMMSDSRYRELKRLIKKYPARGKLQDLYNYIDERMKATKAMSKAIQHVAEDNESKRPWKRKKEHKHKHRSR
jgi:hypothetical protein